MNHEAHKGKIVRSQWASKMGFILATAGAAVGLGNLWKFSIPDGTQRRFSIFGGIFDLCVGARIAGNDYRDVNWPADTKNPVNAYHAINRKTTFIGVMGVLSALSFCLITASSAVGFSNISRPMQLPFQRRLIFRHTFPAGRTGCMASYIYALTCFICYKGTKGIEKASSVMMPALFIPADCVDCAFCNIAGSDVRTSFHFYTCGFQFQLRFNCGCYGTSILFA